MLQLPLRCEPCERCGLKSLHFGRPVEAALLAAGEVEVIARHLVGEWLPWLEAHPAALSWTTLEAFSPALRQPRPPWP